MESTRIIIGMINDLAISKLKTTLSENGYIVVGQCIDGQDCIRKIRALKPDLAILDYNLPSINGYEIARVAIEDKLCDIILIISAGQENSVDDLKMENSLACLIKPINKNVLTNTVNLMIKNRRKVTELENEIKSLKTTLDTRKDVEKAKGLLMMHLGISEDDAYKRLQKQSMDRGIPMREIARAVILAYDI